MSEIFFRKKYFLFYVVASALFGSQKAAKLANSDPKLYKIAKDLSLKVELNRNFNRFESIYVREGIQNKLRLTK